MSELSKVRPVPKKITVRSPPRSVSSVETPIKPIVLPRKLEPVQRVTDSVRKPAQVLKPESKPKMSRPIKTVILSPKSSDPTARVSAQNSRSIPVEPVLSPQSIVRT